MKTKIFTLCMFLSCILLHGQEVHLRSAVMTTSGLNESGKSVNISRWRIGQVYQIVMPEAELSQLPARDWDVLFYPNPTLHHVNLQFQTVHSDEFDIQVVDNTGKSVLMTTKRKVLPSEVIPLDLSGFISGVYLISITDKTKQSHKIIKINKI